MSDRPHGADGPSRSPQIGMTRKPHRANRRSVLALAVATTNQSSRTPLVIPPPKQRIFGDAGGLTALQCSLLCAAGSRQSPDEAPDAAQAGAAGPGGRNGRDAGRRWAALPPAEGDTYPCEDGPSQLLTIALNFVTPSGWVSSDDSCAVADWAEEASVSVLCFDCGSALTLSGSDKFQKAQLTLWSPFYCGHPMRVHSFVHLTNSGWRYSRLGAGAAKG
jgi:hypothetical protein